jgi:hypothetical protein
MFSTTLAEFRANGSDTDAEDLALARWCAKLGEKDLAISFLRSARADQLRRMRQSPGDPLEIGLQKTFAPPLLTRAYRAFADQKLHRPDLLANFEKIAALCPNADLSKVQEAIRILERMIGEDVAHPVLSEAQVAALSPEARAEELVFRLRDETRQFDPVQRGAAAAPSNGPLQKLEDLGLAAAPALIKALDDDSFTREVASHFIGAEVNRVQGCALSALKAVSGLNLGRSNTVAGSYSKPDADAIRTWWAGISPKGEKNYLMERIAAGDAHYPEFATQLLKKYADEGVPFLMKTSRTAADLNVRVTLSKALWKVNDPRCRAFFADRVANGQELGDRVAAAHGLRLLHDARAVSAMCSEWKKLAAANGGSDWPVIDESDPTFENPWSISDFLATSNAPEASLCLGEYAASLPVEWRAKIVSRLADFAQGKKVENAEPLNPGAKKAIEDVLHGFLTDTTECPIEANRSLELIGAGRICDLAALELHELWPQRYEFDRWLSPAARTRQCLVSFNVRARELGESLSPLPAEAPRKPIDPGSEKIVSDVTIVPPLDKSEFGARIAALRGAPLDGKSIVGALIPIFSKPEKEMHGFVLNVARFKDGPGISIHLLRLAGPGIEAKDYCQARILTNRDTQAPANSQQVSIQTFQRYANSPIWQNLSRALDSITAESPQTAFTVDVHFNLQSPPRTLVRSLGARPANAVIPNPVAPTSAPK